MRALILLIALAPLAARAADCDAAKYPKADWAVNKSTRTAEIAALEAYAFTLTGTDEQRLGLRTDSLLIIKGGEVIYERYARGWDQSKRHLSWSVAKSITSALTGIAVQQGALSLDESICKYLAGQPDKVCKISVRNLLEFASGIDWQEEYEDQSYQVSSVIAMLFGEGHRDMLGFITRHRSFGEPGAVWRYSTAEATVLAAVVKAALLPKLGEGWAWKGLFDRLGMKGVVLEEDVKKTPLGGSHVFATPRDYARFGYLFLHDGCWDGIRLLPEDWVKRSTEPSGPYVASATADDTTPSGRMWWLNKVAGPAKEKPWKDAPDDAYSAIGHWGQYVVVVPSADVVIVRTGDDRKEDLELSTLIPLALEVAK